MCELTDLVAEYEAVKRWDAGEIPMFSYAISDELTCGFGRCDNYGFWEFPLYPADDYSKKLRNK